MSGGSDHGLSASSCRNTEPFAGVACLVGLGANLGDREQTLRSAIESLRGDREIEHLTPSGFYETAPIGGPAGQDPFLNAAVSFKTQLPAARLLERLQALETELGRQPSDRWAARVIDLDLLLYGDQTIATRSLSVPHPWLPFRRFVLEPAAEVAAAMIDPTSGQSVGQLLARLDRRPIRVAVAGDLRHLRTELAHIVLVASAAKSFELVDDSLDSTCAEIRIAAELPRGAREALQPTVPTLLLPSNRSRTVEDFAALIGAISDCPRRQPDLDT